MKKNILLTLILFNSLASAGEYGLHFDDRGNIVRPDQAFLAKGIDDEKDGFRNSALKNFKKSAEYGNFLAMSLVGLYLMQDKDYVASHAWYRLVDLDKIPNGAYIAEMINNLEQIMSPKELKKANKLKSELAETYGTYPTLLRREQWKNNLQFTGTRIKGYIPPFLQIQLNSGLIVTGSDVKRQVENFTYNYEFDVGVGEVILEDVEMVEKKQAGESTDDN